MPAQRFELDRARLIRVAVVVGGHRSELLRRDPEPAVFGAAPCPHGAVLGHSEVVSRAARHLRHTHALEGGEQRWAWLVGVAAAFVHRQVRELLVAVHIRDAEQAEVRATPGVHRAAMCDCQVVDVPASDVGHRLALEALDQHGRRLVRISVLVKWHRRHIGWAEPPKDGAPPSPHAPCLSERKRVIRAARHLHEPTTAEAGDAHGQRLVRQVVIVGGHIGRCRRRKFPVVRIAPCIHFPCVGERE
mmetsp:Transcript_2380/g.6198  ORF Transcript_2380/g.6198 Transcript_2380/m.6198 type:complete len:246 (+) Transcript_2380:1478-2215(+)